MINVSIIVLFCLILMGCVTKNNRDKYPPEISYESTSNKIEYVLFEEISSDFDSWSLGLIKINDLSDFRHFIDQCKGESRQELKLYEIRKDNVSGDLFLIFTVNYTEGVFVAYMIEKKSNKLKYKFLL